MLPLLFLAAAIAQGPTETQNFPRDLMEAVTDWGLCRGRAYAPLLQGSLSDDEIAEVALAACTAEESRLADVGVRHFGPSWRGAVADFRVRYRGEMVTQIRELRSGGPVSDPRLAWGLCLGASVQREPQEAPEAAAERAFAECTQEEDRLRARWEQTLGPEYARTTIATQREVLRNRMIEARRAARR